MAFPQPATVGTEKLQAFMGKTVGDWGAAMSGAPVPIGDKRRLYRSAAEDGPAALAEVLGETGDRLDASTRRFLEDGLSADFRDVVVHTSDRSHRVNAALGTTAFTIGNHICFSRDTYDPGSWQGRFLLAHELAHVVQSRLGATARLIPSRARRRTAEAEADAAAMNVICGQRYACSVALPVGQLAAWGPAGHYYTVYYVLLAAGVPNETAQRLAFFAQMPDEVDELDAVSAGRSYVNWRKTKNDVFPGTDAAKGVQKEIDRCLNVQRGLHCLTGADSWTETVTRRNIIEQCGDDRFVFGLALHALGDSYAHRQLDNERVMYVAPAGHGAEWRPFGKGRHFDPDMIRKRPALYREYATLLYHIACGKWPGATRRVDEQELLAGLEKISKEPTDARQISTIRNLSKEKLSQAMDSYAPESGLEELRLWKDFRLAHPSSANLDRAFVLAQTWSGASSRTRRPIASGSG